MFRAIFRTFLAGISISATLPAAAFELQDLQPGILIEAKERISNFDRGFRAEVVRCKNARGGEDPRGLNLDRAGAWFLKTTSANTAQAKLHPKHTLAIDASRDLIQYQGSMSKAVVYPNSKGKVRVMRCKR